MSDAPLRKVRAGDALRIVDADYNAFIDAALARRGQQHNLGQGPPHVQAIVTAQNVSGEDAPMHVPCSLVGEVFGGSGIFRFDKPDDEPYGILLEPVPAGDLGLVAMAGGPYQVNVHAESGPVAGGDSMLPVSGQWAVEQGIGPFVALTTVTEGTCWVVFQEVVPPAIVAARNQADMWRDGDLFVVELVDSNNDVVGGSTAQRPHGLFIPARTFGLLATFMDGVNVFVPADMRLAHRNQLRVLVVDEEGIVPPPEDLQPGDLWLEGESWL